MIQLTDIFSAKQPSKAGITLVEALVAMAVMSVLGMVIYTFIVFSSKAMRDLAARQLMQQESSTIAEVFMRSVRNGSFVTAGGLNASLKQGRPTADSSGVTEVVVRSADSLPYASFSIEDNYFKFNYLKPDSTEILSSNLWTAGNTISQFKIFRDGEHVQFYLDLYRTVGDDTIFLSQNMGDVRCKN